METTIEVHEAKTQLSRLIERVADGEKIIITRNGVPVAELRRVKSAKASATAVVSAFQAFREKQRARRTLRRSGETLRELAHEGHRR